MAPWPGPGPAGSASGPDNRQRTGLCNANNNATELLVQGFPAPQASRAWARAPPSNRAHCCRPAPTANNFGENTGRGPTAPGRGGGEVQGKEGQQRVSDQRPMAGLSRQGTRARVGRRPPWTMAVFLSLLPRLPLEFCGD